MSRKNILIIFVLFILLTNFTYAAEDINIKIGNHNVTFTDASGSPFIENSRTLVPLRVVTESLGLEVQWDSNLREAIVLKDNITVRVPIDKSYIYKNDTKIENDSKAVIVNGRTYLPIRVVLESFNYNIGWDNNTRTVLIDADDKSQHIQNITQNITIDGRTISIKGFKVDLKNSDLQIKTALAKNTVGHVDNMKNIADVNNALLAINGTYFAAYDDTEIKDPYGVLVVDGEVVHNANKRSVIGFKGNEIDIDRVDTTIKGSNGEPTWKYSWNGYWLNHSVLEHGPSLTVYNNYRGLETYSDIGKNYIVKDGYIVEEIDNKSVKIPEDGYVVNLYGQLGVEPGQVYDRFEVGYPFKYNVQLEPSSGDSEFWNSLDYGTGAGPALLLDGTISIDYFKENFTEKKITEYSWTRSAIGYTHDGEVILITTTATIPELAEIMKSLGCFEAMALDGGASSGIYYKGNYVWEPGRELSNIIYIK